jgi:hypothetical protein
LIEEELEDKEFTVKSSTTKSFTTKSISIKTDRIYQGHDDDGRSSISESDDSDLFHPDDLVETENKPIDSLGLKGTPANYVATKKYRGVPTDVADAEGESEATGSDDSPSN